MIIKTKLSEKDFVRINFILLYRKIFILIITIAAVLSILLSVTVAFTDPSRFSLSQVLGPVIIILIMPVMVYFIAKKNYKGSKRIGETIEYEFTNNDFLIRGESFSSQLSWDKVYKVTKLKHWVLIWQNNRAANIISRRDIWEGDITKLKEILTTHQVKNNL